MAIHFNHTILLARDSKSSAAFLAEMLALPAPRKWGPFYMVTTENDANLDYMDTAGDIVPQHYAFLTSEPEFDAIFDRIEERKLAYWADPAQTQPGKINHHDGGRGIYFKETNGHLIEIITRPYGSGGWNP
ncbi:MAG: VOC family protein [Bradyrhizobium sp.]|nr:VOC family protein [Bradyrhizobium sp.]